MGIKKARARSRLGIGLRLGLGLGLGFCCWMRILPLPRSVLNLWTFLDLRLICEDKAVKYYS